MAAERSLFDLAESFERIKRTSFHYRQETMDQLLQPAAWSVCLTTWGFHLDVVDDVPLDVELPGCRAAIPAGGCVTVADRVRVAVANHQSRVISSVASRGAPVSATPPLGSEMVI